MTTATKPLRVELTGEWKRRLMAQAVPGSYWDPDARMHVVDDPDPRTAAVILRLFPDLARVEPELERVRDRWRALDTRPEDNATDAGLEAGSRCPDVWHALHEQGQAWFDFQNRDLGYLREVLFKLKGAYLGWERGLGKTLGGITLDETLGCDRVLVACTSTAKEPVWLDEYRRLLPDHEVVVLPALKAKREATLADLPERCVLVVHYEQLGVVAGTERYKTPGGKRKTRVGRGWDAFGTWDLFIFDEGHRLSNPTTVMHRAAAKVPTRYRLLASGSIIQNHPEEMFGQLNWLFPETYKRKWADWCDRYVDYVNDGYAKVAVGFKEDQLDKLRRELGVFMVYRRRRDELVDLPPRHDQTLMLTLEPEQRRHYDEMLTRFWTVYDDGTLAKASNPLAQLNHLRRIATYVPEVEASAKLDWAVESMEDNEDEAFAVFGWYRDTCYALAERLKQRGIEAHVITGETKKEDRPDIVRRFQAGAGRALIGTIETMGESLNLHRASQAVVLDRSWNPTKNAQTEDRIDRIGQERPITVTHLVARGTVDELRVLPTLASKEAMRRAVLGGK